MEIGSSIFHLLSAPTHHWISPKKRNTVFLGPLDSLDHRRCRPTSYEPRKRRYKTKTDPLKERTQGLVVTDRCMIQSVPCKNGISGRFAGYSETWLGAALGFPDLECKAAPWTKGHQKPRGARQGILDVKTGWKLHPHSTKDLSPAVLR